MFFCRGCCVALGSSNFHTQLRSLTTRSDALCLAETCVSTRTEIFVGLPGASHPLLTVKEPQLSQESSLHQPSLPPHDIQPTWCGEDRRNQAPDNFRNTIQVTATVTVRPRGSHRRSKQVASSWPAMRPGQNSLCRAGPAKSS